MNSQQLRDKLSIMLLLFSLLIGGCGETDDDRSPESTPVPPGIFKVAMLLPGAIDDKSWSQAGYEGLHLIEQELGAQVVYTANAPEAENEQQTILRQYAQQGFDFIIAHGGEFMQATQVVAEEFPRTKFAVTSNYSGNNKNLGALEFHRGEVGYLAGVVAALKTKTHRVAYIGGESYPTLKEEATSFERGVISIDPDIEVSIAWVGSWSDAAKARKIAQSQIAAGIDVLAVNADRAALAAYEVAKNERVYVIGWVVDQHELAPETIVTSSIYRMPILLLEGAILVQQGRWEGKQYKLGFKEKALDLAPFYGMLTPEEEEVVNKAKVDIITGKIEVSP